MVLDPRWGANHFLRRYPEVAAPKNPSATSGYRVATLRVDGARKPAIRVPGAGGAKILQPFWRNLGEKSVCVVRTDAMRLERESPK